MLVCGFTSALLAPSTFAQSAAGNEADYHNLLEAIASAKLSLEQNRLFIAGQQDKISSLRKQLAGVDDLKASVEPMIGKMVTSINAQIKSDYPFMYERRLSRLDALNETFKSEDASIGDKYRKALNIYKFEVNYGVSLETEKGNHPIHPVMDKCKGDDCFEKDEKGKVKVDPVTHEKVRKYDGRYLRYGRLAYVYMDNDGKTALRYDLKQRKWVEIPSDKVVAIRRAVRIASGEAGAKVVMTPVVPFQ